MQSRRLEDVTARYPELAAIAEQLAERSAVLDGEVVALRDDGRPSFQLLQRRMGLTDPSVVQRRVEDTPVDYIVFDLLHLDGACTRDLPYARAARAARRSRRSRARAGASHATASAAEPSCSKRLAARAWRAWWRSASTVRTGPAVAAANGSRRGSGAARSS